MRSGNDTKGRGDWRRTDLTEDDLYMAAEQARARTRELVSINAAGKVGSPASGVKIRIGNRHFIATAAHFLREAENIGITPQESEFRLGASAVKKVACEEDGSEGADVGLIEVSGEAAASIGPFVEGSGIQANLKEDVPTDVLVCGTPSQTTFRLGENVTASLPTTFQSATIPFSHWPANLENAPVAGMDVFVEHPDMTEKFVGIPGQPCARRSSGTTANVKPHGVSGGGIWHLAMQVSQHTGIRFPDIRLLALQVSYCPNLGLLRGVRIAHWLNLAMRTYPDIKGSVADIMSDHTAPHSS